MNKKVLYITYDGMTDQLGQSQILPYLEILAKEGYQITLISAEKKDRLKKEKHIIYELLNKSGIAWKPIMFTSKPPVLAKMFDQWKLNRKAAELYQKEKFDFIHCRSYVPVAAAIRLYHRYGVPYLFDMRGFWVDERVDNGQWNLKNPFYNRLYKIYKKKEREYLQHAKHIITLTSKGKQELTRVYKVPEEKISIIPCCADLCHFDYNRFSDTDKAAIRKKLNINNENKVLSYLGSLGGWYLTDEMLYFFKVLKAKFPDAVFLFITHNKKEEIISLAESKGIDGNAIRVTPASRKEVPSFLSVSDWGIFFIKDAYSKRASSPTKQGEIMAMGIPVICNDIGDTGKIVEDTHSGVVIKGFEKKYYEEVADFLFQGNNFNKQQIRQSTFQYYDLDHAGEAFKQIYRRFISSS